tara:strand:+ start:76 stop:675 length:600 start_codon:yes stop_codon:yes gene_type:complete
MQYGLAGYENSLKGFRIAMKEEIADNVQDEIKRTQKKQDIRDDLDETLYHIMVLRNAVRDSDDGIVRKFSEQRMKEITDSLEEKIKGVNDVYLGLECMDKQLKVIRYNEKKLRYLHNLDVVNAEKYSVKAMWLKNEMFELITDGEIEAEVRVTGYTENGERCEDYVGPCNEESVRQFAKSMMSGRKSDEALIKVAKQYV